MKLPELVFDIRDFVSLRIECLHVMNDGVQPVDQSPLPTLDVSQIGVQTGALACDMFQVTFTCNASKVLVQYPSKADQVLDEFAPVGTLVRMLKPSAEVLLQFYQAFFDAALAVIQAHANA